MKASLIALTFAVLAACAISSSVTAQGVIFNYTIHVDFFAYSCSLSITQVTLYDPSGRLVGTASSPNGGEVEVSVRTPTPISALTATAYGIATWSSYYAWPVNGSGSITLGSSGDYWITIRMS
jgi:hypothetical protein